MSRKAYNRRTWLNNNSCSSTGNVVAYDGIVRWKDENIRSTFLSISDCSVSVRLHKTDDDSMNDFINKMKLLKSEIELFINHLDENETNMEGETNIVFKEEEKSTPYRKIIDEAIELLSTASYNQPKYKTDFDIIINLILGCEKIHFSEIQGRHYPYYIPYGIVRALAELSRMYGKEEDLILFLT